MKTILNFKKPNTMKNFTTVKLFAFILFLISYANCSAFMKNDQNDPEYFKTFRKNESPKATAFMLLDRRADAEESFYYIIYKETSSNSGYYFKISFDKDEQAVATYISVDKNAELPASKIQNLKSISSKLLKNNITISPDNVGADCVIKCHRANGCYDKDTNLGVILCSMDCQTSCA